MFPAQRAAGIFGKLRDFRSAATIPGGTGMSKTAESNIEV